MVRRIQTIGRTRSTDRSPARDMPPVPVRTVDQQALSHHRSPTQTIENDEISLDNDPKPFMRRGFAIIALSFVGFGGWAMTAPLDSAAVAPGNIIVDGGRQKIQHLEGGTVLDMLVRDGDRVEQGQILMRLDSTQVKASRSIVEGTYLTAKAEEARVLAELRNAPQISFNPILTANAGRSDVKQFLDVQQKLFVSRATTRRQQIEVFQTRIDQLNNEIAALNAEHQSKTRQIALTLDELEGLRTLLTEGLTAKTEVLALERAHESLKGDRLGIEAQVAKTNDQISEVQGQIALQQSDTQDKLNQELKDAQLRVIEAREKLVGADDVLQRVDIRAPVSGIIANNNVVTVGGVVAPGELIMEVVPTKELLVIDARVSIQDVDSIRIGQKANVVLTGFNQATTPILRGDVDHVSADRQIDPATNEPYFQAKIIVSEDELARLEESQELKPGMPADAIIVTGERTVLQYLIRPITQSLARSWREE